MEKLRRSGLGLESSSENDNKFSRKIKEGAERRILVKERVLKRRKVDEDEFGSFEKHTKGIGMKLLEKMGYVKGCGLGKNQEGIVVPIQPTFRLKNMGMGYSKPHENHMKEMEASSKVSAAVVQGIQNVNRAGRWLKLCKTQQVKYVSVEELVSSKQDVVMPQKVIDMRGPQVRISTILETFNVEEEDVPMPELQHNMKLIVDLTELEILKAVTDLGNARETVAALQEEWSKLQLEVAELRTLVWNVEDIIHTLDQNVEQQCTGTLNLESLAESFFELKKKYPSKYDFLNLSIIACSNALPPFIQFFQIWDPLTCPSHGLDLISLWNGVLQPQQESVFDTQNHLSPYFQLIQEVVLPAVQQSGNAWNVRCPYPMIDFIHMWEKLLPPLILQTVLNEVVFPKIASAVESWDPSTETVPIHCWIHCWLPMLGDKLTSLYPSIRHKLGNVLHAWHPSDRSAHTILSPWKTVFDATSWENMMVRYILPKLQEVMADFIIDPANQKLHQFDWVMIWATVVPTHHMVTLLEVYFFSKLHKVLHHWLSCAEPNFEEITQWYKGWKQLLPPELLASERVEFQLNFSLYMMNQAAEGLSVVQPSLVEYTRFFRVHEQMQFEVQKKSAVKATTQVGGGVYVSRETDNGSRVPGMRMKEVVEAHAQYHTLSFKPKARRMHNGLQVYGFGSISIIIDSLNEKVYAQTGERWSLVSLEQLVDLHRSFVSKS